jgi:transposase-like protein
MWADVGLQVERWADLGLSLRQMQGEIAHHSHTQVGLRTLNQIVNQYEARPDIELTSVPSVVMLDAIWVTLLQETDGSQTDTLQRKRQVKVRHKVCVLVALGLYPQSQRWGILAWHVADSESQPAWEALLLPLEERGLYRQKGLELLIHDGGTGLIAALNLLYPTVPHQRCTFHKLRNLWHSIDVSHGLSRDERQQVKRDILQQAQAIFYAHDAQDALHIQQRLVEQFQHTQPKFVETLHRDWTETIAFFRVLKRFPDWRRTAVRTTSLLERVNRMLRRLFRPKGAFHSLLGLLACVNRVLAPKRLI